MSSLNAPVTSGSDLVVKPSNNALNQEYTFYTRVVAGSTTSYFGSYNLKVGCYAGMVTYTDSASFSNTAT